MGARVKRYKALATIFLSLLLLTFLVVGLLDTKVDAQGGVTVFASLRVNNFYRALPRASLTITNASTITATGTFQRLTSTAAVGTSGESLVMKPAGTVLTLINVGSNTITLTETTHLKSAGNVALGATDAATFYSDGTSWYEVGASNN